MMKKITSFEQIQEVANQEDLLLFYAKSPFCIVCQDTAPLVNALADELSLPVYEINIDELALARGQMNLFTAPVILIYHKGREVHRQGRFIDLDLIKKILRAYLPREKNGDQ